MGVSFALALALRGGLERVELNVTLFINLLCLATYPSSVGAFDRPLLSLPVELSPLFF